MRVALVLVVAGVATMISGCSGGSGNGRSGRGAYFDAVVSRFDCGTATPESTPDPTEVIDEAQRQVDAFANLTPPPELASVHRTLAEAEQAVLDFVRQTGDATTPPVSARFADRVRAFGTAEATWQEAFVSHYRLRLFRMEGASMEPAFHSDDLLAFSPYEGEELGRWQPILFQFPLDEGRLFVKRIVALPGETVEIRDERILINDQPLDGDTFALQGANYAYGPVTVPADSYFVLGDNRRNSYDSHAWGTTCPSTETCDFVPRDNITGQLPATGTKPLTQGWCE